MEDDNGEVSFSLSFFFCISQEALSFLKTKVAA